MAGSTRCMLVALALFATPGHAREAPPSRPQIDAPELARLGSWPVGTSLRQVVMQGRLRFTATGAVTSDRAVSVRLWYPALPGAAAPIVYTHSLRRPGATALDLRTPGVAIADAAPVSRQRFPLVLLSHGYGGWGDSLSYLGENLASKGYVAATIDHEDPPFADAAGFALSFGSTMLDRAQDQRGVLARLLSAKDGPAALIDREKVALIGYSMGGFGALATAGATYDASGAPIAKLPAAARAALAREDAAAAKAIDALVLIAPWGGRPADRSWTAAALGKITAPTLMIAGDADDIVGFADGARWIFDGLARVDRRLLVYRDARHNIGGNPAPPEARDDFTTNEYFAEPVWRTERLNAINQHFVAAFLDLTLKGDRTKAAYLDTPPSGGAWRGFQPRWSLGFQLERAAPVGYRS